MVSVSEAERIILGHLYKAASEKVAFTQACGRVLAEEIKADRDLPPFNRATMDGVAISFEGFEKGERKFQVEGIQAAGQAQLSLSDKKSCIEIMTGAPLPIGTDTVIPYEVISIQGKTVSLSEGKIQQGQNIHLKSSDAKQGETLLIKGVKLSPAEIALLASVGKREVLVYRTTNAAVISTGDELVEVDQIPLSHQIRKSNSYALGAALQTLGVNADSFHMKDNKEEIAQELRTILEKYELIILSGGVSKGKFDFVPEVLESLGVKKLFHGVSQRPGKPMWFGCSSKNFVFALPGNPVSTFMCFQRYVVPWLASSLNGSLKTSMAILAKDFSFAPQLTYFLQVKLENENGRLMAYPMVGGGSGDFANLKDVDGFLQLPLEQTEFKAGASYSAYLFRLFSICPC
jgi:molybdopterin molybdotransferase